MRRRRSCVLRRHAAAGLLGLIAAASAWGSEMTATMSDLAGAMTQLLRASSAPSHDPQDSEAALSLLGEHAGLLSAHLERDDAAFIAAALEKQTGLLRRSVRAGDRAGFAMALDRAVGTCVACHLRTPRDTGRRFARRLVPPEVEAGLPPRRRARIQAATRRYEEAQRTLRAAIDAGDGDRQGLLQAYLDVSLLGLSDPMGTLAYLDGQGDDAPILEAWRDSLRHWIARDRAGDLQHASERLDGAEQAGEAGRVDAAMAMAEAQRWLGSGTGIGSAAQSARAHLLLGRGERILWTEAWLPMPELHLEQAILLDPGGDTARAAFRALEEALAVRFEGAPFPVEVAEHLERLRP